MRHMNRSKTDALFQAIEKLAAQIPSVQFEIEKTIDKGSVCCDGTLMHTIETAAKMCGTTYTVMPSGAGHDANPMAHRLPIGMIFVPSRGGLSHCKEEWTDPEDLRRGVEVLYHTVLSLDAES